MFTLGLVALFCAACVDDSTGSGGEVNALLEKYNNPNSGGGAPSVTTYTVKFNANGGTGAVHADIPVSANNSITLPDKGTLSNGELVFSGWNTKPDGTGTNYPANAPYTVTGTITLYATWKVASTGGDGDEPGLVLADGEAWVSGNLGYIFMSNNRFFEIYNFGGSWWYADSGSYESNGNIITINSVSGTYNISGSKLLLSKYTYTFAKTSGISPKAGEFSFTDNRDGKSYNAKVIGTHIWMTKNMNYNVSGSFCYDNDTANCTKYGRLYDWSTALTACPAGWRLPTIDEWSALISYAGILKLLAAGWHLFECSGGLICGSSANDIGYGTDDYGFSALPGGLGYTEDYGRFVFAYAGAYGYWWTSTDYGDFAGQQRIGDTYVRQEGPGYPKTDFISVRCVLD